MKKLTGKVAIVTGASSGIGHATATLLAEEGAQVVVGARRKAELDRLVAEIETAGGDAIAMSGDVRDEGYARALVDLAETTFGGLDIAFNNAGMLGEMGPTTEVSAASFSDTLTTNLIAAFLGWPMTEAEEIAEVRALPSTSLPSVHGRCFARSESCRSRRVMSRPQA